MQERRPIDLRALSDVPTPCCIHVAVTLRIAEHIASDKRASHFAAAPRPPMRPVPRTTKFFGDAVRTIIDVGGGTGAMLAEVLRARPHLRGTLVDLPALRVPRAGAARKRSPRTSSGGTSSPRRSAGNRVVL